MAAFVVLLQLSFIVALIAATVVFGYPGLIVGLLSGVAIAFVAIVVLTADGLVQQKRN